MKRDHGDLLEIFFMVAYLVYIIKYYNIYIHYEIIVLFTGIWKR